MILHERRKRPEPWQTQRTALRYSWLVPLLAIEWVFEWIAFALSRWSFLEVLEYLGSFSILIAVIFYFSESGDRVKQKHYQAWQVINTAQGKGGSGGRIEALQELVEDGVPLVGVDVSGAFLQGIRLPRARLIRADLNAVDARNSDFQGADFMGANLHSGNFRDSDLSISNLQDADLGEADLCSANLSGAVLDGATLDAAELGNTDLGRVKWREIKSLKGANIRQVHNAPEGFIQWATQHGAVTTESQSDCP
ncbi:MAG TPA: pentapeptide repeat-containing protein [Terriglobia bacterium]|nr:pentapeptide repeat-containing protein [Terriglobia bacterium]